MDAELAVGLLAPDREPGKAAVGEGMAERVALVLVRDRDHLVPLRRCGQDERGGAGGLGRRRQRPSLFSNPPRKTAPTLPAESRGPVKPHPVSSLSGVLGSSQPPRGPG